MPLISERSRVDFIAQFFNAFNHTQWGPALNQSTQQAGARSAPFWRRGRRGKFKFQ